MKKNMILSLALVSTVVLVSSTGLYASATNKDDTSTTKSVVSSTIETPISMTETTTLAPNAPEYTDLQLSADYVSYETITLKDNATKSSKSSVTVNKNIITITEGGTYVVSGNLSNGQIVINSEDDTPVQLVLDNVTIHNETSAPIYVIASKKYAMITLNEGTTNTLTDGETYVLTDDEGIDSVIYAKQDLIINGTGTLNLTANYNDAIKSKDSLHIVSGTFNVTSKQDAFYGKNAITIDGGIFNVVTSTGADSVVMTKEEMGGRGMMNFGDGTTQMTRPNMVDGEFDFAPMERPDISTMPTDAMNFPHMEIPEMPKGMTPPDMAGERSTTKSSNTVTEQAVAGEKATTTVEETTEDTGSNKGFKSKGEIVINDGTFILDTYDDTINASTFLEINGGTFSIKSGDDAIKSDYLLTINGGTIDIELSYEAIESKVIYLNGGTINAVSFDDTINASDPESTTSGMPMHINSDSTIDYENDPLIYFNGATVTTSGDGDSVDANGSVIFNDGDITLHGVNQGGELALDFDKVGLVNGGNLLALGGTATLSSNSTQNVITTALTNTASIGETITITNANGDVLFKTIANKSTNVVTFSSSSILAGETYTITYGNNKDTVTASTTGKVTNNGYINPMGGGQRPTGGTREARQ